MEIIAAVSVIALMLSAILVVVFRDHKYKIVSETRLRAVPVFLIIDVAMVLVDVIVGGNLLDRLVFDMSLALLPMMHAASSLWKTRTAMGLSYIAAVVQSVVILSYLLAVFGLLNLPRPAFFHCGAACVVLMAQALFALSIWYRLRDMRSVMKSGTVWSWVNLCVDAFYMTAISIWTVILLLFDGVSSPVALILVCVVFAATVLALSLKLSRGTVFVLLRRHERRIVESMKVSQLEIPNEGSRMDNIYKDVFERVVEYFNKEKPYLRGELTINEVVLAVYSNKVYISRAISQFTGRNFCQFVNYYRIMHAVEVFRNEPELKVAELSVLSGFNSVVSFNMAFRLFMNENPSDWCRKERYHLQRKKK